MGSVTLWLLRHPRWEKPVLLGYFLGFALLYAGLCYGAWCHNQRVEANCARSRCP